MQKKIITDVQDRIKEILTPEDYVASCIDRNDLEFGSKVRVYFLYGRYFQSKLYVVKVTRKYLLVKDSYYHYIYSFSFYVHEKLPYVSVYGTHYRLYAEWVE
jgi:hypothetical protein